jgi:flagellin-like protein
MKVTDMLFTDETEGVSPVVGVILMVAVTVVLSAIVASFALDAGEQTDENARAGVTLDNNGDGTIDVQAVTLDTAENLSVRVDGTEEAVLNDAGDTATVPRGVTTIVGDTNTTESVILREDTTDAPVSVDSGVTFNAGNVTVG